MPTPFYSIYISITYFAMHMVMKDIVSLYIEYVSIHYANKFE